MFAAAFLENDSVSEVGAFRANLEVCRQMARRAAGQHERRAWLDMAESWRLLILTWPSSGEEPDAPANGYGKGRLRQNELELGDLIAHLRSSPLTLTKGDFFRFWSARDV
jgi:uncharacterized protein with PIN domain